MNEKINRLQDAVLYAREEYEYLVSTNGSKVEDLTAAYNEWQEAEKILTEEIEIYKFYNREDIKRALDLFDCSFDILED